MIGRKLYRSLRGAAVMADNFFLAFITDRPRRVRFVNSVLGFAEHERIKDRFPTEQLPRVQSARRIFEFGTIDGAHSAEYIRNDTSLALEMVRPGGIVVWHDYLVWNDVTTFLQKFSESYKLSYIAGTSLVIYEAPVK